MSTLSDPLLSGSADLPLVREQGREPSSESMAAHLLSQYGERLGCWIRNVVPKQKQAKIDCSGVINSTFAAVCQGVGQRQFELEGEGSLWALLTTIARRKAIDRMRRKVSAEGSLDETAPLLPERGAGTNAAVEAELRDSIDTLCQQLSEAEVAYLTLRLQGGWQQTEIAEEMQISTRQVRRIARAVEIKALELFGDGGAG